MRSRSFQYTKKKNKNTALNSLPTTNYEKRNLHIRTEEKKSQVQTKNSQGVGLLEQLFKK